MPGWHSFNVVDFAVPGRMTIYASIQGGGFELWCGPLCGLRGEFPVLPITYLEREPWPIHCSGEELCRSVFDRDPSYLAFYVFKDGDDGLYMHLRHGHYGKWLVYELEMPSTAPMAAQAPYPQPCSWHYATRIS